MRRTKRFRLLGSLLAAGAVVLAPLALAVGLEPAVHAQMATAEEPQVVRISVTDKGFDAKDLQVKLEQGRPVELKFEFKQSHNDSHIFEIGGYGLRTEEQNQTNREVSIKFVPTQLGSVVFYCILDCEIHHLLADGRLTVVAPGGGGGAPVVEQPTSLTVASLQQASAGEPVTVWATVRDSTGKPIAGALVRFYVSTQLFPDKPMLAGSAATDGGGQAKLVYTPRADGEVTVQAKFEGGGIYKTAEATYSLKVANAQPAYVEKPRGLSIGRWAPQGVVLVLMAVWGTYAFVLYQVFRIARPKGEAT